MSTGTTSVAMHWIDGKRADSDEHRDSVNPATGEVIGSYAMGGPKEAQAAIVAAKRAFADPAWRINRTSGCSREQRRQSELTRERSHVDGDHRSREHRPGRGHPSDGGRRTGCPRGGQAV